MKAALRVRVVLLTTGPTGPVSLSVCIWEGNVREAFTRTIGAAILAVAAMLVCIPRVVAGRLRPTGVAQGGRREGVA